MRPQIIISLDSYQTFDCFSFGLTLTLNLVFLKIFLSRFEVVSRGIGECECMEAEEATVFCQIETWDTGDTIPKSDTSTKK